MITDDDPTVVALPASKDGQIEGLANTTLVESIGSFQGHIWKAELKTKTEGEANTRLDWYVSSPVKRQSSFISATEEIVAVSCVANTCAFQLRSHEEPFDTRLVFVENLTHVHMQVKQEIKNHTSQSVLVSGHLHETIKNTISWFVMEEVVSLYRSLGNFAEYRLDISTSQLIKTERGISEPIKVLKAVGFIK